MKKAILTILITVGLSIGTYVFAEKCTDEKFLEGDWENNQLKTCYGNPKGDCEQGESGAYSCQYYSLETSGAG